MPSPRNTYFNCQSEDGAPVPWHPPDLPPGVKVDGMYWGPVLVEMERTLDRAGLTFYLTQDLERLPSYGRDVVVLLLGDEFARMPAYVDRVRAVFKNHAIKPELGSNPLRGSPWLGFWSVAWHARTWRYYADAVLRRRSLARGGAQPAPMFRVPIGVLDQPELALVPMADRAYDVFFGGSIGHHGDRRRRETVNPKVIARKQMVRELEALKAGHPELAVKTTTTEGFLLSIDADTEAYSSALMNSRVALVPRGAVPDTFRFWQALRYGCALVVDALPRDPWFFDGAPVVRIHSWRKLEQVVTELLSDGPRLEDLQRASIDWWRSRGSPEAVGAYMADRLNSIRD